jgi:hypothetical protein
MALDDMMKRCKIFPTEVHIIFNGVEDNRILKVILDRPPNSVYYFIDCNKNQKKVTLRLKFLKNNILLLKRHLQNSEINIIKINYENFKDVIQEISLIIGEEIYKDPNARIYINATTGNRTTYYASIRAMANWDCEVYTIDKNLRYRSINPPASIRPDSRYIEILKIIDIMLYNKYNKYDIRSSIPKSEQFIKKKDLIDKLHEYGYIKLNKKIHNNHIKSQYLYTKGKKIFNYLEDDIKAITISNDKKNKKIKITDFGRTILTEFKYLN